MKKAKKLYQVIDEHLSQAKSKGYNVTKVFGIVSKYKTLAKLSDKMSINEVIEHLNGYLSKYNLIAFTTRKGVFFAKASEYKPVESQQDITL